MTDDLTRFVHAGEETEEAALGVPLSHAVAYAFADAEEAAGRFDGSRPGYRYVRHGNPTVGVLEAKIAALEGAADAVALASGMAAVHAALTCGLRAGDHLVASHSLYGETGRLIRERLARFGIETTFVNAAAPDELGAALRPNTRVIQIETPANPNLAVVDLCAVSELAREHRARLIVDGTFATPWHQKPLRHGADLVVHSATKALGGHGDVVGGLVAGSAELIEEIRSEAVRSLGAVMSASNAWLIARGIQTLGLRMRQASGSAQTLAERLSRDPRIERVHYPGLPDHPGHEVAARQMVHGFGAVLAFEVAGGLEAGRRVYDRLALISRAVNLGDVRSLLTHPASTTHCASSAEARAAAGIGDGLMRLAVGIEAVEDLWGDLDQALG